MANVLFTMGMNRTLYLSEKNLNKYSFNLAKEHNIVVLNIARRNPQNQYYVVGLSSDYKTIKNEREKYIPSNLHFIIEDKYKFVAGELYGETADYIEAYKRLDRLVEELRNIGIDYAIQCSCFAGGHLPDRMLTRRGTIQKCLVCQMRSALYSTYVLNELKVPYIVWNTDERYLRNQSKSTIHAEKACIGFKDDHYISSLYRDLDIETQRQEIKIDYDIPIVYNGIDTLILNAEPFKSFDRKTINIKNKNGLFLFLNPSLNYDRLASLQEYVLPYFEDAEIYGNWFKSHPELEEDKRFKGTFPHDETMKKMVDAKYTLIVPTYNASVKTNCSVKFWECLFYKVIPFMHENYGAEYWQQYHKIPKFLWVKSGEELKQKIEYLEKYPEAYTELLKQLEKILKPEYLDFSHIENGFKETIEKYCKVKW